MKTWTDGTVWRLPEQDRENIENLLRSSGFSSNQIQQLCSENYLSRNGRFHCYEIRPPDDLVFSLSTAQRNNLYPHIGIDAITDTFAVPHHFAAGGIDPLLRRPTNVPKLQIDRIRAMTYRVGQTFQFSDIPYLLRRAATDRERLDILKLLCRQQTIRLRLKIPGPDLIPSVAEYWSAQARNKSILPILESVAAAPGVDTLDIAHLLPPFPRKILYTYPSRQGEAIADALPDCFWTSFSFFSESPPDRHFDKIDHVLSERYEKATPPEQFGDLIMISGKDGMAIHACNYIAGDFVFTKNGHSPRRPWIISTLQDVVRSYLIDELKLSFFRLKPKYRK